MSTSCLLGCGTGVCHGPGVSPGGHTTPLMLLSTLQVWLQPGDEPPSLRQRDHPEPQQQERQVGAALPCPTRVVPCPPACPTAPAPSHHTSLQDQGSGAGAAGCCLPGPRWPRHHPGCLRQLQGGESPAGTPSPSKDTQSPHEHLCPSGIRASVSLCVAEPCTTLKSLPHLGMFHSLGLMSSCYSVSPGPCPSWLSA